MAIVFTKDLSTSQLLLAYNNNTLRLITDTGKAIKNVELTGDITAILYSSPVGEVYFNLKEYIKALINTKNFADNTDYNILAMDSDSFCYDSTDGSYKEITLNFKMVYIDLTFDTATRTLEFIAGVEQLSSFKRNEVILQTSNMSILSPVSPMTNNTNHLYYWEGYPFSFSYFLKDLAHTSVKIKNRENGLDYIFPARGKVTQMYIGDGRTDVSLEDFLPLQVGINNLTFEVDSVPQDPQVVLHKVDTECGVYLKFVNRYSRPTYWLFYHETYQSRTSKYIGQIDNDSKDLSETTSPTIAIGKISDGAIKLTTKKLDEDQAQVLQEIIDSPKIYLFTGDRFSRSSPNDWIEVQLKSGSFLLKQPKQMMTTFNCEIDLPNRNTLTL